MGRINQISQASTGDAACAVGPAPAPAPERLSAEVSLTDSLELPRFVAWGGPPGAGRAREIALEEAHSVRFGQGPRPWRSDEMDELARALGRLAGR